MEVVCKIEGDSNDTKFVKETQKKGFGHGRQIEGEKSSFRSNIDKLLSRDSQLHKYPRTSVTSQKVTCVTEQEETTGGVTEVDVTHQTAISCNSLMKVPVVTRQHLDTDPILTTKWMGSLICTNSSNDTFIHDQWRKYFLRTDHVNTKENKWTKMLCYITDEKSTCQRCLTCKFVHM